MTIRGRTPAETGSRWHTVDADGQVLGRLATQVATILRGKHRPDFAPYREGGDHVIVTNAARVRLTGRKTEQKFHRYHTGYPGGLKEIPYAELLRDHPERVVQYAVWGMLPKNKLGQRLRKNLRVYPGADHPHGAQQPAELRQGDTSRARRPAAAPVGAAETQEGGVNG